jgi:hypothetical protein
LGTGAGKLLIDSYDKKRFWGVLMRKRVKIFEGVDRKATKIYHKCHIAQTMGIAVVGTAFEDSLENEQWALP